MKTCEVLFRSYGLCQMLRTTRLITLCSENMKGGVEGFDMYVEGENIVPALKGIRVKEARGVCWTLGR